MMSFTTKYVKDSASIDIKRFFRIINKDDTNTITIMKLKLFAAFTLTAIVLAACDDTTDTLGNSLTNETDQFDILTDTFRVSTRSITVDSVLSRGLYSYLGHVKDTETNTYVTSNYTTQFAIIEGLNADTYNLLPSEDSIRSLKDGKVVATSCGLIISFNTSVGDTLNPMKLTVCEMGTPAEEGVSYYSNYDPEEKGLIRTDGNGITKNKVYTIYDLNLSDSLRNDFNIDGSNPYIYIPLNDTYIDKDGNEYDNYGTYLMQNYYEHPEYFSNSYSFIHNICPGFYIKSTGGLGVMSEIDFTDLFFKFKYESNDTIYDGALTLSGTEEVMQTTRIVNDKQSMQQLANDSSCTYLKTPAGIFTEVTLPIDSIMYGHETDSISSAKVIFTRLNSKDEDSEIDAPQNILMLPKDSLFSFFENKDLPDSKISFSTTLNSSYNTYTFNNISTLVTAMANAKKNGTASTEWNKVVLVPVTLTTTSTSSSSSSSSTMTNVSNQMSLSSTRLVGGSDNKRSPITISVIYNKFKN